MPVVRRRVEIHRPEKLRRILNLREYYEKRNRILIIRNCGGLGDILMHRMLFEDIKLLMPDAEIHFACPPEYHAAVVDHPFVDKVLRVSEVDRHDYTAQYNTTTACGRYEMKIAPLSDRHRSDIWAAHCGFKLTRHDMHFRLTDEEIQRGREIIESARDRSGISIAVAPISAMQNKNLPERQLLEVIEGLRRKGHYVFGLHTRQVEPLVKHEVPMVCRLKMREWMSVINQVGLVISVDTSHFHCAGGMRKPVVGIFTFINGRTYAKYYETAEVVQGPCPLGHSGCYNWGTCPVAENPKPCAAQINAEAILAKVDVLLEKWSETNSI